MVKPLDYFHNAVRVKEIATLLARYGFGELLDRMGAPRSWAQFFRPDEVPDQTSEWERIRIICEELGTTFIKLGQVLSTRSDILPHGLVEQLRKLQDAVKPLPFAEIEEIIEGELGRPKEEVFASFNEEPLACASLGQVYRARLRGSEREVVVKVLKPQIRRQVKSDLELIGWFARELHEKVKELRPYDLPALVEESRVVLLQEIDFRNEARNIGYFNEVNQQGEHVFAPEVFSDYSGERILVTEFIDGTKAQAEFLSRLQRREVVERGAASIFEQIFVYGFLHADPHAGNLLVTQSGRLCLIDWGSAIHLTRDMRYFLADLVPAVTERKPERLVRMLLGRVTSRSRVDIPHLEREVAAVLIHYYDKTENWEYMGEIMVALLKVFGENGLSLTRDYALLAKSLNMIHEVVRDLYPEADLALIAEPALMRMLKERWHPANVFSRTYWEMHKQVLKLKDLPSSVHSILARVQDEGFVVDVQHEGLSEFTRTVSASINRLVFAIVVAALIVGSSLVITTGVEPLLWGFPAIGIVGYVISGLLGLRLLWDLLRDGRRHRR